MRQFLRTYAVDLVNEDTEDFKEIMRQYSDFIIIIPEEDQKTEAASDDSPLLPEEDIENIGLKNKNKTYHGFMR